MLCTFLRNVSFEKNFKLLKENRSLELQFSNYDSILRGTLNERMIKDQLGRRFTDDISESALVYTHVPQINGIQAGVALANIIAYSQWFSNALWLMKDNASSAYLSFYINDSNTTFDSNMVYRVFTKSDATYENVSYSNEEIDNAIQYYNQITYYYRNNSANVTELRDGMVTFANELEKETTNFARVIDLITEARKSDFLPTKVANYISVLECLMCVSHDNTHRVSERTALFISSNFEERKTIYNNVKSAYDIRSKYVHGSTQSKKRDKIKTISVTLDDIVRKVILKCFNEYPELNVGGENAKSYESVNKFFNNLIFKGDLEK